MRSTVLAAGLLIVLAIGARAAVPPFPGITTKTLPGPPGSPVPVPGGSSVDLLVDVTDLPGTIVDVDVTIALAHPSPGQLNLSLLAPDFTTVALALGEGGSNADVFTATTFDDQAAGTPSAPNVHNFTYTAGVPTGPIQPEQALGALVGHPAEGPWVLVIDASNADQDGTLQSWSLTVSTIGAGLIHPGAPVDFAGAGMPIPDGDLNGARSLVSVSGVGRYLYHVAVTVDISHPNAGDLDLFLTAPSGQRIDLVQQLGAGQADLYAGTTFDDQAGTPITQAPLPPSGTALGRVVGEGALAAFLGENPNGPWLLTAVDLTGGDGDDGTLNGWTLSVETTGVCGDGVVDPGETCDDGPRNGTPGDACSGTCQPAPPACRQCRDAAGSTLADALDPACGPGVLTLRRGQLAGAGTRNGRIALLASVRLPSQPSGSAALVLGDGKGAVTCLALGTLHARRGRVSAGSRSASGRVGITVTRHGRVAITGHGMDLRALQAGDLGVGLDLGTAQFAGRGVFHPHGRAARIRP